MAESLLTNPLAMVTLALLANVVGFALIFALVKWLDARAKRPPAFRIDGRFCLSCGRDIIANRCGCMAPTGDEQT